MTKLDAQYEFRDAIIDELIKDLVGPADGADEVITDLPLDRYVAGVLWPADNAVQELPDPDSGEAEEDGGEDVPIAQALVRYPTSMGITFSVDLSAATLITVDVQAARYTPNSMKTIPVRNRGAEVRQNRSHGYETPWM